MTFFCLKFSKSFLLHSVQNLKENWPSYKLMYDQGPNYLSNLHYLVLPIHDESPIMFWQTQTLSMI